MAEPMPLDFHLPSAPPSASASSPTSGVEAKHIVRLFTRMAHLYAHRWVSAYGQALDDKGNLTASAKQWMHDLRGYTPEDVAVGIQSCMSKRIEWPPGPIEFKNLCDGIPSPAEVLDRDQDYGPVCAAIRQRIDWWNIENLPSSKVREAVAQGIERALVSMRRSGEIAGLRRPAAIASAQREAIA